MPSLRRSLGWLLLLLLMTAGVSACATAAPVVGQVIEAYMSKRLGDDSLLSVITGDQD